MRQQYCFSFGFCFVFFSCKCFAVSFLQQNVVEVTTDQQIVEEVTATETISSEVVAGDNGILEGEGIGGPVHLIRTKQGKVTVELPYLIISVNLDDLLLWCVLYRGGPR